MTIGRGDSLFVFLSGGRVHVFTPRLVYARSFTLPPMEQRQVHALSNGNFILAAAIRTPERIGFPYHVMDAEGRILQSFGDPKVHLLMDRPRYADRRDFPGAPFVVAPDEKSIWTAPGYHLRQYAIGASTGPAFDITDSPWMRFPTWEVPGVSRGRATTSNAGGWSVSPAMVDSAGLLWITAMGISREGRGTRAQHGIEVFDPKADALLISEPSQHHVEPVAPGVVYTTAEDADGIVTYTIWRVRLHRP